MAFAIVRTAKLKTAGNLGGLNSHLTRSKEVPNADEELLKYNSRPIGSDDLWKDVQARIQEAGITKIRKDGVLAVEHLMTASPEHFDFNRKLMKRARPSYGVKQRVGKLLKRLLSNGYKIATAKRT